MAPSRLAQMTVSILITSSDISGFPRLLAVLPLPPPCLASALPSGAAFLKMNKLLAFCAQFEQKGQQCKLARDTYHGDASARGTAVLIR
jgi:hypothetical protein